MQWHLKISIVLEVRHVRVHGQLLCSCSLHRYSTFDSRGHRHERLLVWEKNLINVTKYTPREIEGNRVGQICAVELSIGIL